MNNNKIYAESISIGIVQTTIEANKAWPDDINIPQMSASQDDQVWFEIRKALRAFQDGEEKPRLILLPELSLPRTRLNDFETILGALNFVAVVGADYRLDRVSKSARNEGIVYIPKNFYKNYPSRYCSRILFGKTFPSPSENNKLSSLTPSWSFRGDDKVYVFDFEEYGKFGVSICYDFMDIERALMYRGKIQHLFVIAYNRDLEMFRSLAESFSRTIFCNVVICNTGYFGGSLVVSPYYEVHRRRLYSHYGSGLFTTQVIKLPVRELIEAQKNDPKRMPVTKTIQLFKHRPPGF